MEELIHLDKFYNKLKETLTTRYNEKIESVFLRILDIKSVDRFRLLKEAALTKYPFSAEVMRGLLQQEFIRETDEENKFTLTGKGLLNYEKNKGLLKDESIFKFLDEKYFDLYSMSDNPLSEKERLVVFVMIAARAFSEKSSVDLKKGDTALNRWEEVILSAYNLLKSLNIISRLSEEDIFGKEVNLHKVSNFFRHKEKISKKTKGLYKIVGDQRYYLEISGVKGKIDIDSLRFLFRKVIGNQRLSPSDTDKMNNFCTEIATTKNIYLFDIKEHLFHNPEYDTVIRDALLTS